MNLEKLNVVELTAMETKEFEGGGKIGLLKKIVKYGIRAVEAMDIGERFMEGWNSVECKN